ncbi:MAG: pyridoxine 5'-phosphate synthase [Lentisphaeria bacterium]|nr:pyridoxine 5'-phosphate synthase [Lentisphaeria bacterium]
MLKLGVNIDHIATVRQARKAVSPRPLDGARLAEKAGAWGITAHLREDRRHILDEDIRELAANVKNLNMEMAVTDEMVRIACEVRPHSSCLVPEKRQELTTEGGLDVAGQCGKVRAAVEKLHGAGIVVSLFIDPEFAQLDAAKEVGADYVELHTGTYSNASGAAQRQELERLKAAAEYAHKLGLSVNAGHGIDYENIAGILEIPYLSELNIGHSIVGRAIMAGMEQAVREMIDAMKPYAK